MGGEGLLVCFVVVDFLFGFCFVLIAYYKAAMPLQ